MAQGKYGDTNQGAAWTGGVGRVQSKRRPETGSVWSPLLLIAMIELRSRQIGTKDILRKLLYVDGLAVVADGEAGLKEQLIEWYMFNRDGLTVSLEKAAVV